MEREQEKVTKDTRSISFLQPDTPTGHQRSRPREDDIPTAPLRSTDSNASTHCPRCPNPLLVLLWRTSSTASRCWAAAGEEALLLLGTSFSVEHASEELGTASLGLKLAWPLPSCVTSGKFLHFSVPQCPPPKNGDSNSTYFIRRCKDSMPRTALEMWYCIKMSYSDSHSSYY